MVGKTREVRQGAIMPTALPTDLAQYCPELEQWPERWHFNARDIAPAQRIVELFNPFLLHLLGQRLATNTLYRHRDHLWMLGGEIIRHRYEDANLKKMRGDKAIAHGAVANSGRDFRPANGTPSRAFVPRPGAYLYEL